MAGDKGELMASTFQRERLTPLAAPEDGVVTSAQPLMILVFETAQVTAEISVSNQDPGLVNAGQSAAAKLETFPYKSGSDSNYHEVLIF
jgi:hemolysin D